MRVRHLVLLIAVAGVSMMLSPSIAAATSAIEGVSCISSSNCIGAGNSDASGETRAQIFTWNGTAWSTQTTPSPSDTTQSQLSAVSCRSASDCMAVGKYVDTSVVDRPLAMKWNGSTWTVTSLPMPSGGTLGELVSVTCPPSSSGCEAAGSYFDSSGVKQPLALWWDGTDWEVDPIPLPSGATSGEVSAVMCKLEYSCQAVGSYINSSGTTMPLANKWDGSTWVTNSVPVPGGATYGQLSGVSCSSWFCATVGTYIDSSGVKKTLGAKWDGAAWSSSTTPVPGGATSSGLSDVSCVAVNVCSAVGEYEVNSDKLPLAAWWNGTSWSQQSITTDTYGAVATVLNAVSCLSSTACHATGSITYGHSATPRQLAYRFDGTAWVLTESGNYQRSWSALNQLGDVVEDITDSRAGISCATTTFCVRVGSYTHGEVESSRGRSWNGSAWSALSLPSPSGATETALRGVKCTSATHCIAVGSFVNSSGETKSLSYKWNGTSWALLSTGNPSGSTASSLSGVTCLGENPCIAVGSYVDSEGTRKTLAMNWNGTSWSIFTTPNVSGATSNHLKSISCTSTSFCRAVGYYVDSAGVRKTLAMSWNGTTWSIGSTPNPSDAKWSELRSVTCLSTTFCFAVGSYANATGVIRTQAMKFGGSSWSSIGTTDLSGATASVLSGVYCSSTSACLAVGNYISLSKDAALTMTFQLVGGNWSSTPSGAAEPAGALVSGLSGISCTSATACVAVGDVGMGAKAATELAESFNGTSWTKSEPPTTTATWNGVACRSNEACITVGSSTVGGSQNQQAARLEDSGWESMTLPTVSQSNLLDVSCTGPSECTAVGSQGSSPLTLAERWNGSQWSTQTTANPSGGTSVILNGVSCASASLCIAAGRYVNGTSPANALIEKWNGTNWSIDTVPIPAGATQAWFEGISCSSTTACVAVGTYQNSSGVKHALIERWSGTSWAIQTPPEPGGATRTDLYGVSCKLTACTAVGTYWNASGNFTYVLRWNGSAWSIQSSPNVATSTVNTLTDVSCFTSIKCVAVGTAQPTATGPNDYPMAMGWDGTSWTLETIPMSEGTKSGALYDVSCTSTADCLSVGTHSLGSSAESEALSVRSMEPKAPPGEAIVIPFSEEFSLTPEQEADAISILKEDPDFQAAVGEAKFTAEAIPWLETTSNETNVLVGAVLKIYLEKPEYWGKWWSWPAADYEAFYESGTYSADTVEASASEVVEIFANLDAVLDSSGEFLDGEVVQLQPMEDEGAVVTLAPSEETYVSGE